MNVYPNRRKNPMPKDDFDMYIEVDTETEFDYIESINDHMRMSYMLLQGLENYIETEKI